MLIDFERQEPIQKLRKTNSVTSIQKNTVSDLVEFTLISSSHLLLRLLCFYVERTPGFAQELDVIIREPINNTFSHRNGGRRVRPEISRKAFMSYSRYTKDTKAIPTEFSG